MDHEPNSTLVEADETSARFNENEFQRAIELNDSLDLRCSTYLRQGDWNFIPQPDLEIPIERVEHNAKLGRRAEKPHCAEWLYRSKDPARRTYVRGRIALGDHSLIELAVWHRVVANSEAAVVQRRTIPALFRRALPKVAKSYTD